ncbi:hypothetical protein ACPWSH_26120, partial [Pandoraea pneumonica]
MTSSAEPALPTPDTLDASASSAPARTARRGSRTWQQFARHGGAVAGAVLLTLIVLVALCAGWW